MGDEVIAEINLVVIAVCAHMDVKHPLGIAFGGISLVETQPVVGGGHTDVAVSFHPLDDGLRIKTRGHFHKQVDNRFSGDARDGRAADMVDARGIKSMPPRYENFGVLGNLTTFAL